MSVCLVAVLPIAKKAWRFYTIESGINPDNSIDLAMARLGDVIDLINEGRMKHPRSFKRLPKYLKFILMKNGIPRIIKNRKIGEFLIHLESREVEVTMRWD